MAEKNRDKAIKPFRWNKGQSGNPKGRPMGARTKLAEEFLDALYDDWQTHGADVLAECRETKPVDYIRIVTGLLPKEVSVSFDPLEDLSDEDLERRIRLLTTEVLGTSASLGGESASQAREPLAQLPSIQKAKELS